VSASLPFSQEDDAVFGPEVTNALAAAVDEICRTLNINGDAHAREVIATRVIDLARRGERDPIRLRDRVLQEAGAEAMPPRVPDAVLKWRGLS
jgi:hypothetical protein